MGGRYNKNEKIGVFIGVFQFGETTTVPSVYIYIYMYSFVYLYFPYNWMGFGIL